MKFIFSVFIVCCFQHSFCQDIPVEHFQYFKSVPPLYPPIRNIGPNAKHFEQEFAIEMGGLDVGLYKITYDSVKQLLNLRGKTIYSIFTDSLGHLDSAGIYGVEIYWGKPGLDQITGIIKVGKSGIDSTGKLSNQNFRERLGYFDITTKLYSGKCLFFVHPGYKLIEYDFMHPGILEYLGIHYKSNQKLSK